MIQEAIAAVRAQDFEDWELLVADGGSEPVRDLMPNDPRIRYTHSDGPNRINEAMRAARGQVFNICADDDLMRPGTLRHVDKAIGEGMWLYGRVQAFPSGVVMGLPWDPQFFQKANFVPCPAVFWKREAAAVVGEFDLSVPMAADWDYWLRLAARWTPVYTPRVLADYRIHPGQDTARVAAVAVNATAVRQRIAEGYYV